LSLQDFDLQIIFLGLEVTFQQRGFLSFLVNEFQLKICIRLHLRGLLNGFQDAQFLNLVILIEHYPHDLYLSEQELPLLAGQGVLRVGSGDDREFSTSVLVKLDPLDVPVVDGV
jgi:hypothetical protein